MILETALLQVLILNMLQKYVILVISCVYLSSTYMLCGLKTEYEWK